MKVITIRLLPSELKQIKHAAIDVELSMTAFIKRIILDNIANNTKSLIIEKIATHTVTATPLESYATKRLKQLKASSAPMINENLFTEEIG